MKSITESVKKENKLWLKNNASAKNLAELYTALQKMNAETFNKHVNQNKHDIYEWVKYNYNARGLAKELLECTTKESILLCLENYANKNEKMKQQNEQKIVQEALKNIMSGALPATGNEEVKTNIFKYNQKKTLLEPKNREEIIKELSKCHAQ